MCELEVRGKNLAEGVSRNLPAEHMRKGHARQRESLKCGQVWNYVWWGIRGKNMERAWKGQVRLGGKRIEPQKTGRNAFTTSKWSLSVCWRSPKIVYGGVTDLEGKMTRRSTTATVPMERWTVSYLARWKAKQVGTILSSLGWIFFN